MPLRLRRVKFSLVFWTYLKSYNGERIAKDVLNNCGGSLNTKGRGYGWKINQLAEKYQIEIECSVSLVWGEFTTWIIPEVKIDLEILDKKQKCEEMGMVENHVYKYIQATFYAIMHIYTGGSKDPRTGITGIGVYIPEFKISITKRLTSKLSIYAVEMVAIIIGLSWVEEVKPDRVVICSDSASVLTSLFTHQSSKKDLMCEIFTLLWRIQRKGVVVGFCWVPEHVE